MKRLTILFAVMLCVAAASAQKFSYSFNHTPLADALMQIAEQHPDIHINFIYNELDKYPVTATIHTDDAYDMLRQIINDRERGSNEPLSRSLIIFQIWQTANSHSNRIGTMTE